MDIHSVWSPVPWVWEKLWRWDVVGIGATLLYSFGVGAMYADDYIVGRCLYFLSITWLTSKVLAWEETKAHKSRVGISVFILVIAVCGLALSEIWTQHRKAQHALDESSAKSSTNPEEAPEQERSEVLKKLDITAYVPGANAWNSIFTVHNNGPADIVVRDFEADSKIIVTDGAVVQGNFHFQNPLLNGSTIKSDGGSASLPLLSFQRYFPVGPIKCADIVILFQYELITQPSFPQAKKIRMAMIESNGQKWYAQPLEYSGLFCSKPPNAP